MAKSKIGARNIVVNEVRYLWRATGNDSGISLFVWPLELPGATIACSFDYDQRKVPAANGVTHLIGQLVVTSRIVRRVIEHAVAQFAYDARAEGKQLELGRLSKVIDTSDAHRSA